MTVIGEIGQSQRLLPAGFNIGSNIHKCGLIHDNDYFLRATPEEVLEDKGHKHRAGRELGTGHHPLPLP